MSLPKADPTNSAQNAFVQDWLTAWFEHNVGVPVDSAPGDAADDWDTYERVIETIQETYDASQVS